MDHYYASQKPLPADFTYLCRVAKCRWKHEKDALNRVLNSFFESTHGQYCHARIDKEILKYQQRSDTNRKAIEYRWNTNRNTKSEVRSQISEESTSTTTAVNEKKPRLPPKKNGIDFDWPTYTFLGIAPLDMERWQEAYPAIPIPDEIDRAAAWLQANPANRKSNYTRFLVNWFARSQQKAGRLK